MKWRSWLSAVFGAWFVVAPWALAFSSDTNATWGSVIVGVILLIVSVWEAVGVNTPSWKTWQSWIGVLCGFWFIIQPFLGHFEEGQYYAMITPGLLTIVVNLWTLMAGSRAMGDEDPTARA